METFSNAKRRSDATPPPWQTRWNSAVLMSERRRQRRMSVTKPIQLIHDGRPVAAALRNVSSRGMFVDTRLVLPVGTLSWVKFSLPTDRRPTLLLVHVRHQHNGGLGLEVDISQTLAAERLQALLQNCSGPL